MTPDRPAGLREAAQFLVDALRDRPATNLTGKQWRAVDDVAAALAPKADEALRQSQDIEAAARELSRLWFDIEGTGPSSYAADAVRDHGNEFVEAMWRLRAALARKAEEAPR